MKLLKRNILNIYGNQGRTWLAELPQRVEKISTKWGLSELALVDNMSYNYVMAGLKDNTPIILKLSPDHLQHEAMALKAFAGRGAVEVLEEEVGALLLERAMPGISLKSYFPKRDEESIKITCDIMKRLHHPSSGFPHIKDWLKVLNKEWDVPYLQKARQLRDRLLGTSDDTVLLHGDLHHDNILSCGNEWRVIDPKGVIGEPAFEVAVFIRNPTEELLTSDILKNRIHAFAKELNLDFYRIRDWCFVESVLSRVWDIEDNMKPSSVPLTKLLYELLL